MGLFQLIKQRWTSQTTLPQIADEIRRRVRWKRFGNECDIGPQRLLPPRLEDISVPAESQWSSHT